MTAFGRKQTFKTLAGDAEAGRDWFSSYRLDFGLTDNSGRGAMLQPCKHHLKWLFISADKCLDTAVTTVANPSGDTEPVGLLLGVVAKTDTLDPAFDANTIRLAAGHVPITTDPE